MVHNAYCYQISFIFSLPRELWRAIFYFCLIFLIKRQYVLIFAFFPEMIISIFDVLYFFAAEIQKYLFILPSGNFHRGDPGSWKIRGGYTFGAYREQKWVWNFDENCFFAFYSPWRLPLNIRLGKFMFFRVRET